MLPSLLARFLDIWSNSFPKTGGLFLSVGIAAVGTEFRYDSPGQTETCDEAGQCHFLLSQGVGIYQPKELLSALLVQQGGNFLAFSFKLLSLLITWPGVESIFQCFHVVAHGASLLCSDTPYHTLAGIATGSGENYQFRHIFFSLGLTALLFVDSGAIRNLSSQPLTTAFLTRMVLAQRVPFLFTAAQILRGAPLSVLHFFSPLGAGGAGA